MHPSQNDAGSISFVSSLPLQGLTKTVFHTIHRSQRPSQCVSVRKATGDEAGFPKIPSLNFGRVLDGSQKAPLRRIDAKGPIKALFLFL